MFRFRWFLALFIINIKMFGIDAICFLFLFLEMCDDDDDDATNSYNVRTFKHIDIYLNKIKLPICSSVSFIVNISHLQYVTWPANISIYKHIFERCSDTICFGCFLFLRTDLMYVLAFSSILNIRWVNSLYIHFLLLTCMTKHSNRNRNSLSLSPCFTKWPLFEPNHRSKHECKVRESLINSNLPSYWRRDFTQMANKHEFSQIDHISSPHITNGGELNKTLQFTYIPKRDR